jgi:proton-dependent oligopeptide transporter, POT family
MIKSYSNSSFNLVLGRKMMGFCIFCNVNECKHRIMLYIAILIKIYLRNMENQVQQKGHPKGLFLLFTTEMAERFSYYGMRAIFILFMTKMLLMSDKDASNVYGSYTGLVYLTPLLGGYLCDKFLGNKKSIIIGGLLMALGQLLMFFSASACDGVTASPTAMSFMWGGLTLLIIGNGFFKPNISTLVGQLYPANDRRIDAAFTIFYMGINLGAFFSPLICGSLAESYGYKWGFMAACLGMVLSLVLFFMQKNTVLKNTYGTSIGDEVKKIDMKHIGIVIASTAFIFFLLNSKDLFLKWTGNEFDLIAWLIYGAFIIMPIIILSDRSLTKHERSRIIVVFLLAFFVIFFWAAFEQAGASLTLFAERNTHRGIFGWTMPSSFFQSVNPLAVIGLAIVVAGIWTTLGRRNLEPKSPVKMGIGLALVSLGYVVILLGLKTMDAEAKISMWWLLALYIIHSIGELCLSPIGLSMVSKLSPIRIGSLMMGTWFLANAVANKFAGTLSALIPPDVAPADGKFPSFLGFQIKDLNDFFMLFVIMTAVAAALLFVISGKLIKMMHEDTLGKNEADDIVLDAELGRAEAL